MISGSPASLTLLVVTVAVSLLAFSSRAVFDRFALHPYGIAKDGTWYQTITSGFLHGDITHLAFNMITLFFFGRAVEQVFVARIGAIGFVLFYLSAIVVAILPTYLRHRHDPEYRSLGASGAVSAALFAFILMAPWSGIYLFLIPIPIPAIVFAVLYIGYSIWMDRRGGDNINHSAHLWGAAYGVTFALVIEPRLLGHFLQALANPQFG